MNELVKMQYLYAFHSLQSLLKVTKILFFSDKEHFRGYKGLRCNLCHQRRHRGRRYVSETAVYEYMATNMNRSGYCPSLEHASPPVGSRGGT